MMLIRRLLCYVFISVFASWTLLFLWWNFSGTPTPHSEWTCDGEGRNQMCEFSNFCVSRYHGPFIVAEEEPPSINLINTGKGEDMWFKPKRLGRHSGAQYINETVFVYGFYSPFHFSHYLYNGLIPLYSTMREKGATASSWTFRGATYWNQHTKLDMDIPSGSDIVPDHQDVLTEKQLSPPYKPICFAKAVVGTGDRCSLWYCDRQIPAAHYESFKSHIFSLPYNDAKCSSVTHKSDGSTRIGILNRGKTRHITNLPELIDKLKALDVSIQTIDFDQGCDLKNTAHLVKDLDVLIAPFGNGLGSGLFMKNNTVLISIASRWYNEDWFKWPMTAIGRRIYNFECNDASCQEFDVKLLEKLLAGYGIVLNEEEMQKLLTQQNPVDVLTKYIPGKEWEIIEQYHKDVSRRIDVDAFIPFLNDILKVDARNTSYVELCRNQQCCDNDCTGPLERNVFGANAAWLSK
ncbi:hypothetical protein BC943DRAFT_332163 [Umbelopsis sp. AD052]|nr:hypothetical protein BC943DRAFT_332163 [Umbelopsis sp. AD052]